jgi:very-short-patch-repair endonuclease
MLNVAFTRARDEVHVFHSANIQDFGMTDGSGAIKDWLLHCASQESSNSFASRQLESKLASAQSGFEQQVIAELHNRGVETRPQFPSCGFFIDIVAELGDIRIAIECDGEKWHLDEHGHLRVEDLARQEILERAGWQVVRVPYRSWRDDPQAQIQRLMNLLEGAKAASESPHNNDDVSPATVGCPGMALEKHQWAIIQAVKDGSRSLYDVYRVAREGMGFSRMGPKIKRQLEYALSELVNQQVLKVEEDEVYFCDETTREREYTIAPDKSAAWPPRPRHPRYRRW